MIRKTDDLSKLEEIILAGLNAHRLAQGKMSADAEMFGFELQQNGNTIGGITGRIRWNWMYIQHLWVSPENAGQGHGRDLVMQAEALAKEKQCAGIHVDTFSYQAPEFYKALGFTEFGRLRNYPDTTDRIYLQKRL